MMPTAVPWRRDDYAGAIRTVAGQDFAALSMLADYLSPMCYSFMLRRPPEWIHSVVEELGASSTAKIVPSNQVREYYRPEERFGVGDHPPTEVPAWGGTPALLGGGA